MRSVLYAILVSAVVGLTAGVVAASDNIPPHFIGPGSYVTKNTDGTHPYGESHGIEVGIDVEFSHYEECLAVYVTKGWQRPLGGGAKVYSDAEGEITYDLCEEPLNGLIESASTGRIGDIIPHDDGTFTIDFSATGGNTRVIHPE